MPKEQYMCQLCANHGQFNQPKKGHKQKCPYKECPCSLCSLNTKRRALDQIERQLKHSDIPTSANNSQNPSSAISDPPSRASSSHESCESAASPPAPVRPPATVQQQTATKRGSSSSDAFCVALPATMTKKELKRALMLREVHPQQNSHPSQQTGLQNNQPPAKRSRTIEEAIEIIHRQKSIFHSAEMLAN